MSVNCNSSHSHNHNSEQVTSSTAICSSLVEISENGKSRPLPRRLVLNSTHLLIQKNFSKDADDTDDVSNRPTHGSVSDRLSGEEGSFDSFVDADSPLPEYNKREVTLAKTGENSHVIGISVRGGADAGLPLIISKLTPGSCAALSKQIYIGDAIISINGTKITKMDHDEAVEFLRTATQSSSSVTLKLKYYPTAKPFLSPTQQNLCESNLSQWEAATEDTTNDHQWEVDKKIPLTFALLTRYLTGTDRLRSNAFEVRDATGNINTGIIYCPDSYSLNSWVKSISDVVLGLNNIQIKLWAQENKSEVFYVGWVWEGNNADDPSTASSQDQPWLNWTPKILALRGPSLYYMHFPPGVGADWDDGRVYSVITTLLRVLNSPNEYLDERQHCLTLQIATENNCFPPNGSRQQPKNLYLSTETRQELIKVEAAWTKAVKVTVKSLKKISYPVWWGGKPCRLELDYNSAAFNLYRSSSKPTPHLWSRLFSSLKGSSDDSRSRLTLKFHGNNENNHETMECRDLHRILFTIHSFLLAKVVH